MTAVSSWAIIVDITWQDAFRDVRQINISNDNLTPPDIAGLNNDNWQEVGAIGDTIGVMIRTQYSVYQQPMIRIASTVTTKGVLTPSYIAEVSEVKAASVYPY
jgi:hypothetical protein